MGWWPPVLKRARAILCLGLACVVLSFCGYAARAQPAPSEEAVKATYLYKFSPFIEWPSGAFSSPSAAINLCVVGDDPFGEILDRAVTGQHVGQRPIGVRRLRTVNRNPDCHIAYVAGSGAQSVSDALNTVRGSPVLTITDSARNARAKGIVHFVLRDKRVRFEIDDQAAAENGLVISSKVLGLATSVRPRA